MIFYALCISITLSRSFATAVQSVAVRTGSTSFWRDHFGMARFGVAYFSAGPF